MGNTIEIPCEVTQGATVDSISWAVTSKPETSSLTSLDSQINPLFTPDKNGVYGLTVTAVSGTDQQSQDLQITVGNVAPTVSCSDQTGTQDEAVTLSCTVSDPGEVSPNFTYAWEILEAPTSDTLSSLDTAQTSLTPTATGDYKIQLTVSDGELSADDTFTLAISPALVKIMPLGDSITQANTNTNSYRYELFKRLIDAGFVPGEDFDFIGSEPTNDGGDPPGMQADYNGYAFDKDNEGHWGLRAEEVLAEISAANYSYVPDVALVHLGTNDVKDGDSNEQIVQDLINIVNRLKELNPNVQILLAKLIPASNEKYLSVHPELDPGFPNLIPANITALNSAIANSSLASTPNVTFVDQNTGYDAVADNYDGIHPNATGEGKMAQVWFDALQGLGIF